MHVLHFLSHVAYSAASTATPLTREHPQIKAPDVRGFCNGEGDVVLLPNDPARNTPMAVLMAFGHMPMARIGQVEAVNLDGGKKDHHVVTFGDAGNSHRLTLTTPSEESLKLMSSNATGLQRRCEARGLAIDTDVWYAALLQTEGRSDDEILPPFALLDSASTVFCWKTAALFGNAPWSSPPSSEQVEALLRIQDLVSGTHETHEVVRMARELAATLEQHELRPQAVVLLCSAFFCLSETDITAFDPQARTDHLINLGQLASQCRDRLSSLGYGRLHQKIIQKLRELVPPDAS